MATKQIERRAWHGEIVSRYRKPVLSRDLDIVTDLLIDITPELPFTYDPYRCQCSAKFTCDACLEDGLFFDLSDTVDIADEKPQPDQQQTIFAATKLWLAEYGHLPVTKDICSIRASDSKYGALVHHRIYAAYGSIIGYWETCYKAGLCSRGIYLEALRNRKKKVGRSNQVRQKPTSYYDAYIPPPEIIAAYQAGAPITQLEAQVPVCRRTLRAAFNRLGVIVEERRDIVTPKINKQMPSSRMEVELVYVFYEDKPLYLFCCCGKKYRTQRDAIRHLRISHNISVRTAQRIVHECLQAGKAQHTHKQSGFSHSS
jgi:hypothetical protein